MSRHHTFAGYSVGTTNEREARKMEDYTVSDDRTMAYCHHCPTVLRRRSDPVGLLFAIYSHVNRKH